MANTFDLAKHYQGPDGLVSQSPFWFVAFVRFKEPVTYDRKNRKSYQNRDPLAESTPLVIVHQCTSLNVTNSKSSYASNLQANFESGGVNLMSAVKPGDWVFAWMLSNEWDGKRVLKLVREGKQANQWNDGLKFMGRVQSVRKRTNADPERGTLTQSYLLGATGFSEFGYSVFYEPHLLQQQIVPKHLEDFGLFIHKIVADENQSVMDAGLIDINKMLPALVNVLFGTEGAYGGSKKSKDVAGIPAVPQGALRIPKTAAKWLGVPEAKTYLDILSEQYGTQQYGGEADLTNLSAPWMGFIPDFYEKLKGQFSVAMPPIVNTPFWSLLGNFLNAPVNEMYTSMKADENGWVMPTLTVRQIPFSRRGPNILGAAEEREAGLALRQAAAQNQIAVSQDPGAVTNGAFTRFLDLPRWKLGGSMVWTADLGRSDALRINYVHISGTPGVGTGVDETGMFIRCPPLRDDSDIARAGMKPYAATVSCTFKDVVVGPSIWRDIIADVMVGQHLTLTGSFSTYGIDLPIPPGDNLEYEDAVFHIENVSHQCFIDQEGKRRFMTTFLVSNGVSAVAQNPDEPYAGLEDSDVVGGEVTVTQDKDDKEH